MGWVWGMRTGFRALLCVALAGVLGGCAIFGQQDPPARELSQPPAELALEKSIANLAQAVKWFGGAEASPVRQAHLLAPADWIVCAQSGARDRSPAYALFFNGDAMVHYRIAVEIDDCRRAPYAPVMLPAPTPGPLQGPAHIQAQSPVQAPAPAVQMGGPLVLPR